MNFGLLDWVVHRNGSAGVLLAVFDVGSRLYVRIRWTSGRESCEVWQDFRKATALEALAGIDLS